MKVYTLGFTQTSAAAFFSALRAHGVRRLIDVRLNNVSQLAGFTRREDLAFFLGELCGAAYLHEPRLAPTAELLAEYRGGRLAWGAYERRFLALMAAREIERQFSMNDFDGPAALLCSEPTEEHCHRRLVLDYLVAAGFDLQPVHLHLPGR